VSPEKQAPARTCDDLLDRNRSLIELAEAAIDDRQRQRRVRAERFDRARARGMLLREQSRDLGARLEEIQAATEDRCRRSRRASEESEALMDRPVPRWK